MNKTCPNGHRMRELQSRCGACGWEESEDKPKKIHNHGCSFNGCIFPGTLTESNRADENTSWWCREHFYVRDNPQIGAFILSQMERGEIRIDKSNWRDDAINATLEKLRGTNSEIFFKPSSLTERNEYQEAVMLFLRSKMVGSGLPYNKDKIEDAA